MSDNSDYKKSRTNLYELLPEVYRSDANRAVFENLFNRYLTKSDTDRISGYVGDGNPNAVNQRKIHEVDVHRQAYQLQPMLYNKVGSVEWISSFKDILSEAERIGIDPERIPEWMDLMKFNWVPPIDLDKLVNYRDYYWYDSENPNSRPNYITIRSKCQTLTSQVNFLETLIGQYGSEIPTIRAEEWDNDHVEFPVITLAGSTIVVEGDLTGELGDEDFFTLYGTLNNNTIFQVVGTPVVTVNAQLFTTTIEIDGLFDGVDVQGTIRLHRYNKFVLEGEYFRLFDEGFEFIYRDSTNHELEGLQLKSLSSVYDSENNLTVVEIDTVFTNEIVDGVMSLSERLNAIQTARDCQCSYKNTIGWERFGWDDNPEGWQSFNTIEPVSPTMGETWWDQTTDQFKQWSDVESDWVVVWNNFSVIAEETTGAYAWDFVEGCGIQTTITSASQWANSNKWTHKSDVENFSLAKQAKLPIIEYEWDLEINEWVVVDHEWKYRTDQSFEWVESSIQPPLFELQPVAPYTWTEYNGEIVLDSSYGDLTSYFQPGVEFIGYGVVELFVVESSRYVTLGPNEPGRTVITTTEPFTPHGLTNAYELRPYRTIHGDYFRGYGKHWVYLGESNNRPVNHQTEHGMDAIPINATYTPEQFNGTPTYEYYATYYAQNNIALEQDVTEFLLTDDLLYLSDSVSGAVPLRRRATIGFEDVRVYLNGIRQYGTYYELSEADLVDAGYTGITPIGTSGGSPVYDSSHVAAIRFIEPYIPAQFDNILIEVGEASIHDHGVHHVSVRVDESDADYSANGDQPVSLIKYRKQEQVKTEVNQYPVFDIYNVDGTPAYEANYIFGYSLSDTAAINRYVGLRIDTDTSNTDFMFEQTLVADDGTMYAYRDYNLVQHDIWYDVTENKVKFWTGETWSTVNQVNAANNYYYVEAVIDINEPVDAPNNQYWLNPSTLVLQVYHSSSNDWAEVDYLYSSSDHTLQTIWRKGSNNETYEAKKRDWKKRSLEEYEAEQLDFVTARVEELQHQTPTLTTEDATTQSVAEWKKSQYHHLSTSGDWVGDWEIPDPLYYNNSHENRKKLSYRELLTHFQSIIEAQPKIPGFNGPLQNMFHLIGINDVNYGLGGTIREYNYGFDTFLSMMYVNELTPIQLFRFAHSQYESLLNSMRELYRNNVYDLMLDTSDNTFSDFVENIVSVIISLHNNNDNVVSVYHDSSTYDKLSKMGMPNWIATLPYIRAVEKQIPFTILDEKLDLLEVSHHDGHRANYALEPSTIQGIILKLIQTTDTRSGQADPQNPGQLVYDTFGRVQSYGPPVTVDDFETEFGTPINNRRGVFWYHKDDGNDIRDLYRLNLVHVGYMLPAGDFVDGALWLDITPNNQCLRVKKTLGSGISIWEYVSGLTPGTDPVPLHNGIDPLDINTSSVTAWQKVDLNEMLQELLQTIEQRLYDNAPSVDLNQITPDIIASQYPELFGELSSQAFKDYVTDENIVNALDNTDFDITQPFTWNYKYSTPGPSFDIVDTFTSVDQTLQGFVVKGDVGQSFATEFYVKNTGVNDGKWTVHTTESVAYDAQQDTSIVYVEGRTLVDVASGLLYTVPIEPNSKFTGAESGGDWRDLYEKVYGTPYPHLEPWVLQGYGSKPTWWDEEYKNDNILQWGNRRWKYKHGFNITGADYQNNFFEIQGDFSDVFTNDEIGVATSGSIEFDIDQTPGAPGDTNEGHNGTWRLRHFTPAAAATIGEAGSATVSMEGEYDDIFVRGSRFAVVDSANNLIKTYTVIESEFTGPPLNHTVVLVEEEITDNTNYSNYFIQGSIYQGLENVTRLYIDDTVNPVLEPNINQDITIGLADGRVVYDYGMWKNIKNGTIPAGREYPNGVVSITGNSFDDAISLPIDTLPTYVYFSVNIDNHAIDGEYAPDDILPPFWNSLTYHSGVVTDFNYVINTLFTVYNTHVKSPGANFMFEDMGPVEWEWRSSSRYLYDMLTVAFRIDPVRFAYSTFGPDFYEINGLLINKQTHQVLSHTNTIFHGDIEDNTPVMFDGLNQWYVNYTRYAGIDMSMSDFRSMWTEWYTPLTYQFSSFIDTPSLDVGHRYICVSNFDYNVTSKRSYGVDDFWLHSFKVSLLHIPPRVARYVNDSKWEFELQTNSGISANLSYYDVHNYQFIADPDSDICSIYTWNVAGISALYRTITINGNHVDVCIPGRTFTISDSTNNDGVYEIVSSVFDQQTNTTRLTVAEDLNGTIIDGILTVNYRSLPWETGDSVTLTTDESLPVPLRTDGDGNITIYQYFVIKLNDTQFKLARTKTDALIGNAVDITTVGTGDHYIGEYNGAFRTQDTDINWRHYKLDKDNILTATTPFKINGIQNIINVIDGYAERAKDAGWVINADQTLYDYNNTTRFVGWQIEIERMIQFMYNVRATKNKVPDSYPVTVNPATNEWSFVDNQVPLFETGDPVTITSQNKIFPDPIVKGGRYYIIRDEYSKFKLAASTYDARAGIEIDIIPQQSGIGSLSVQQAADIRGEYPSFEVNPFRQGIWFRPEYGIVSNVIDGPTPDVFTTQFLGDQYGRALKSNSIRVYREDKQTQIKIAEGIANDVRLSSLYPEPYNNLHLASAHLFVDTFEHVLMFNTETTEGQLLYDPFIGLNVTKFEMLFNRQSEFTQRPSVGGQVFKTFFNQGADLTRNIEASIEDIRNAYDTYRVIEANSLVDTGRKTIGYTGRKDYLDNLNLNAKSQFAFWRGQIQSKGSINSIKSFVNSRRFIDAKVDEFWAVKVADFGSMAERDFISMWLFTDDTLTTDLRIESVSPVSSQCSAGFGDGPFGGLGCGFSYAGAGSMIGEEVTDNFQTLSISDTDRWYNAPDQQSALTDNNQVLYFDLKPQHKIPVTVTSTEVDVPPLNEGSGWIILNYGGTNTGMFKRCVNGVWEDHGDWNTNSPAILRHNLSCDYVTITFQTEDDGVFLTTEDTVIDTESSTQTFPGSITLDDKTALLDRYYVPLTNSISVYRNGVEQILNVDYSEPNTTGSDSLSNMIAFNENVESDKIEVVFKPGAYITGLHFVPTNTDIIRMQFVDMIEDTKINNMVIWGWEIDNDSQNPARIKDVKNNVTVAPIQMWDPARELHYHNAIHVVDLQLDHDPATYTNTPRNSTLASWNQHDVGKTWLDTSALHYIPYYDAARFPTFSLRSRYWGQMTDWSEMKINTWVESDIPPTEWDAAALLEQGDFSIDSRTRKSGIAKKTLFKKDGVDWVEVTAYIQVLDAAIEGTVNVNLEYEFGTVSRLYESDVYVNGLLVGTEILENSPYYIRTRSGNGTDGDLTLVNINEQDRITIVKPHPLKGDFSRLVDTADFSLPTSNLTLDVGTGEYVLQLENVFGDDPIKVYEGDTEIENVDGWVPRQAEDGTWVLDIPTAIGTGPIFFVKETTPTVLKETISQNPNFNYEYEYTQNSWVDDNGVEHSRYYFWVEDKSTRGNRLLSPAEAQRQLLSMPAPFMFFQTPARATDTFPVRYTEVIIRGIRGIVNADNQYVVEWTRNFTLRDSVFTGNSSIDKKSLHEQWKLMRRDQPYNVDRWIWDRITESIIGYKLTNSAIRVPSYTRELYDVEHGTDTQFGLGDGQTFIDGELALTTILAYLNDPNKVFTPVDINTFFAYHDVDTPENVIEFMDTIYNTFTYEHVNGLFFEVLHDALTLKKQYTDIFKTSMVALHGVRPFQVGGLFDD